MILKVFSLRDSKAQAFLQPFFSPSKGQAIRALTNEVNNPQSEFYKYASDFTLYLIGEWDDSEGKITTYPTFDCIGNASEFKDQKQQGIPLQTLKEVKNETEQ